MSYRIGVNFVKPTDFARQLTAFLSDYLPGQCGIKVNTIKSYRDTFALFLTFCGDVRNMKIEKMVISQVTPSLIEDFLTWLETERGNSISTRNQRLAALHAFFRYVQKEEPSAILTCQQNLSIPFKKVAKPHVSYLSGETIKEIFAKPDLNTAVGRRDLCVLSVLYDTGARVSELVNLKVHDVRLDEMPVVKLLGKGDKIRHVPLMAKTAQILTNYLSENKLDAPQFADYPLFFNRQHSKLTRTGVTYIIQKYTGDEKVTPHIFRHSKAMHLLQSGVNIIYIRDLLGHVDIATTEVYARADTEMKRAALEKVYQDLTPKSMPTWENDKNLMAWLHSLI